MSARPTQAAMSAMANRIDNQMNVMKKPEHGGPFALAKRQDNNQAVDRDGSDILDYPAYHTPNEKEADTRAAAKAELVLNADANNGNTPFGQVMATDRDLDYVLRKRDQQEALKFEQFLIESVGKENKEGMERLNKILPGFYEKRFAVFSEKLDHVKRLGRMRLYGPQDIDDYVLLYSLWSGRATIPTRIDALLTGQDDQRVSAQNFSKTGIFCPIRYTEKPFHMNRAWRDNVMNIHVPGFTWPTFADGRQAPKAEEANASIFRAADGIPGGNLGRGVTDLTAPANPAGRTRANTGFFF